MTIEDAKQLKLALEEEIAVSLKKFEKDTGMEVNHVDVQRSVVGPKDESLSVRIEASLQ